jgi:hypothetical protein
MDVLKFVAKSSISLIVGVLVSAQSLLVVVVLTYVVEFFAVLSVGTWNYLDN